VFARYDVFSNEEAKMGNRKDYHENEPATQGSEEIRDSKHAQRPEQKGPQAHAEGQHGNKTHARFVEQLHEGAHRESRQDRIEQDRRENAEAGGRHLVENREQHDEAEKNSEHTHLFAERERGRDDGPSDNSGNLHGVIGHRETRASNSPVDRRGLRPKD
jgi:hypothetical protein